MSNERRIYKYQGTLIGDDRVDSIDIDKLNTITPYLSYNSDSSSLEIGSNLYVSGDLYLNMGLIKTGKPGHEGSSIDLSDTGYIYLNGSNEEAYIEFDIFNDLGVQVGLTDKNTKTVFGNSLYGGGNINLYVHYLRFTYNMGDTTRAVSGILYSSNNTDISGTDVSKLNQLIKSPVSNKVLLILSNIIGETCGTLVYNGSTFVIYTGKQNPISIIKIEDTVQPI